MNRLDLRKILTTIETNRYTSKAKKKTLGERLNNFSKTFNNAIPVIVFILFLFFTILGLFENSIIFEGLSIPPELQKDGYNEKVLVNKIQDHLYRFVKEIKQNYSNSELFKIGFERNDLPESFKLPGAGISFNSLITYMGNALGLNPLRVRGEIIKQGEFFYFTVRVMNEHTKPYYEKEEFGGEVSAKNLKEIDSILRNAALHILKYTEPYIAAVYYLSKKKTLEAKNIAEMMHDMKREGYKQRAFLIKSIAYYYDEQYESAAKNIKNAIEYIAKESQKSVYYSNWALYLFSMKKMDDALEKIRAALHCNDNNPDAYLTWGKIYAANGDFDAAVKKILYATQLNKKFSAAYLALGKIYFDQWRNKLVKDKRLSDESARYFHVALELEPENLIAMEALANLYFERREYGKSFKFLSMILKQYPERKSIIGTFVRKMKRNNQVTVLKNQLGAMQRKFAVDSVVYKFIGEALKDLANSRANLP